MLTPTPLGALALVAALLVAIIYQYHYLVRLERRVRRDGPVTFEVFDPIAHRDLVGEATLDDDGLVTFQAYRRSP